MSTLFSTARDQLEDAGFLVSYKALVLGTFYNLWPDWIVLGLLLGSACGAGFFVGWMMGKGGEE